jgi:hypothetical protein
MKRNIVLLIYFIPVFALSQIEKGKYLIDIKGGSSRIFSESGVLSNSYSTNQKTINLNSTIGYIIDSCFVVGVGTEYLMQKEHRSNALYLVYTDYAQEGFVNIESEAIMPILYLGYYKKVFDRLYFFTTLYFEYGNVKSVYNSLNVGTYLVASTHLDSGKNNAVITGSHKTVYTEIFIGSMKPSLIFYLSQHFGLNLELGGIDYVLKKLDADKAQWNINFYPANWKFGIQVIF